MSINTFNQVLFKCPNEAMDPMYCACECPVMVVGGASSAAAKLSAWQQTQVSSGQVEALPGHWLLSSMKD